MSGWAMPMAEEECTGGVSKLSMEDSHHVSTRGEDPTNASATQLLQNVEAVENEKKEKKKKKKKKRKEKAGVQLPSQNLIESIFPWKIAHRPARGRCAIASRNIKAGEVVVAERAVAFLPRARYRLEVCHSCCCDFTESLVGIKCNSCHNVAYCKACKEKALARHRKWCSVYKQLNVIANEAECDQDLVHFILALVLKKQLDLDNEEKVVDGVETIHVASTLKDGIVNSSFQDALVLQTHQDKMRKEWRDSVRKGCELLHKLIMKESEGNLDGSVEELEWMAALVNTNAHGMGAQGLHNTDAALGIFPFVSMLNHSCRPNCCFASEGNVMYVRAVQDISTDNELCVSYINLYEPRIIRRHELSLTKHFECNCQRCIEPMKSSIDRFLEGCMCNVKGCGGVLIKKTSLDGCMSGDDRLTSWICDTCSYMLDPTSPDSPDPRGKPISERPWDLVGQAEGKMLVAVSAYKERRLKDACGLLEDFLAEFHGKLHPLHVLVFDSLTPLMNCHRALGDAEGGVRVCRTIVNCLEKVLPTASLELANFYFCLGEMCSERAGAFHISSVLAKHYKKQAQEAFQRARQLRKICIGKPTLPT